jgi:hypothetical protein
MWSFPTDFFAFPLNLIFLVVWVVGCALLWKHCRKTLLVRFFLAPFGTFFSIGLFLTMCLVIGFTGMRSLAGSWLFVIITLLLQTVLLFVMMRGWRRPTATGARLGAIRWRFLLLHAGLLLAVGSAFWGAPDAQTLRMKAYVDVPGREAYFMDGRQTWLPYEVTLKEFDVQQYDNGVPSAYRAVVDVDGVEAEIEVNEPYARGFGEDVYLVGYDASMGAESSYCILEIVREPWKYLTVAGIVMLLAGALLLFIGGPDNGRS